MDDNCEEKNFSYDDLRDILLKNTGVPKEYLDVDITRYLDRLGPAKKCDFIIDEFYLKH